MMVHSIRCDCKKSFLQSQMSEIRRQISVKTKTYIDCFFGIIHFLDFLQVHPKKVTI